MRLLLLVLYILDMPFIWSVVCFPRRHCNYNTMSSCVDKSTYASRQFPLQLQISVIDVLVNIIMMHSAMLSP